jgi:hypothetical protein
VINMIRQTGLAGNLQQLLADLIALHLPPAIQV